MPDVTDALPERDDTCEVHRPCTLERKASAAQRTARLLSASLFLLLFANILIAMPLATYRERVRRVTYALDALSSSDEDATEKTRAARITATLRDVREALPSTTLVELGATSVRVDNTWLGEALRDYEKLSPSDPKRAGALLHIEERLHAISERLNEIEGRNGDEARNKEAEKARLAAILRRDEYGKKVTQQSALAHLWERFLRWLDNLLPASKPLQPGAASALSRVAEVFVITLALAVIIFVAWKLAPRFLRNRKGVKREKRKARVVLGEHLAPDQTSADLLIEAEALARAGDIRAAIRKGYIALLCELGDRKILRLAQSRTNRDYLRAVQDRSALYQLMRPLTDSFESHWYGFAPATENDWIAFRSGYKKVVMNAE